MSTVLTQEEITEEDELQKNLEMQSKTSLTVKIQMAHNAKMHATVDQPGTS